MPRINTKTAADVKTNAIATATLAAAGVDARWRVHAILASVSAGTAELTVTGLEGGATLTFEVAVGSPLALVSDGGIQAQPGTAVVAALAAAGAGNKGAVSLVGFLEQ